MWTPDEAGRGPGRYWKGISGAIGTVATIVGTLLALGVIHPFGAGGVSVAQAATRTVDKGTSRVTITVRGPLPSGGNGVLFSADGTQDYRLDRGAYTYDYSGLAQSTPGFPTTVSAIVDGTTMYVRLPQPRAGKEWLVLDLVQVYKQQEGVDLGPFFADSSDPGTALTNLLAAGNVKAVGKEQLLDGTEATRYSGTIDLEKVAENAPADQRRAALRAVTALEARGASSELPVQVWIGDDGLVRKVDEDVSVGSQSISVEVQLFDFGVTVHATPPPAALVATAAQLQGA
ncbi:MAG TPA: hypothetical protein VKT18_08055 [Acidimicrobiales bacterium]|nr:hypothetical protein [Acidimicrobiales bacterium]